jgi:hypothetical protein
MNAEGMIGPSGDAGVNAALISVYDSAGGIIELVDTMLTTPWGGCD